jgi:hypothetical protein
MEPQVSFKSHCVSFIGRQNKTKGIADLYEPSGNAIRPT